jgi:nitrilase
MSSGEKLRVAGIQMVSSGEVAANLAQAEALVAQAAQRRARLVLLPENFGIMAVRAADKLKAQEPAGEGAQQGFLSRMARDHQLWMIGGSVPLASNDPERVKQSLMAYGPEGSLAARYDKIHLFRFTHGSEDYDEAKTISAGTKPAAIDVEGHRVGLSICYDLRFPELYRALGDLALIVVPAAFTYPTGRAHWETLLRARAIENQCYVLAAAQGGTHPGGRRTFGHSMLIDPWGDVVASLDEGEGIVEGDINPDRIAEVRKRLPALTHRVLG